MPEGDSLHRAARRLQVLVGERVEVETPHPRAAGLGLTERLDGRRLEQVDAVGKNLVLRFEGGVVLRSHLRMNGRWRVQRRGERLYGRPWLVLRGSEYEAVQWNGPVLELDTAPLAVPSTGRRAPPGARLLRPIDPIAAARRPLSTRVSRLGPDILATPPELDRMLVNLRAAPQTLRLGEALLAQRLVAGIGNMWLAETLWSTGLSPWLRLADASDAELSAALACASRLMRESLDHGRGPRRVYRRAGRPCPRCGEPIRSRGLGDANRTAYWCPGCQRGPA